MIFSHPTRTDEVNDKLSLTQYTDGLTFGTDALLLAAYVKREKHAHALELGGGTGIVSLLLSTREKLGSIDCVEIQPDYAALIEHNVHENGQEARVHAVCADIRDYAAYGAGEYDVVFANPPYMRADGAECKYDSKQIARHEVMGGIEDFAAAAEKKLRYGGRFYCVWRPDRMTELLTALIRHNLEPKRMTFVLASPEKDPSVLLFEAKRGAAPGIWITRPLIIGNDLRERSESPDMCYILEKGDFPKHYEQR